MECGVAAVNKYRLRAFSFGIIFTVAVIGTYYYFFMNIEQTTVAAPTIEQAKKVVVAHDFVVLTKKEHLKLEQANEQLKTLKEQQKKQPEKEKQEKKIETYTLKVKTGMTSDDIAQLLKKAQIIDSERDFIDFMAINGYSKSIQLGSFKLTDEMSYEQIAKTITR